MRKNFKNRIEDFIMIRFIKEVKNPLMAMIVLIVFAVSALHSATINTPSDEKGSESDKNRTSLQARTYTGVFDLQTNSVSNIDFYTTNYGIFGFDIARSRGGGYWPRGSQNQYIFAGGFWFGARKYRERANDTVTYVTITYNPNSGKGWFVPGRINYGGPGNLETPDEDLVNNDERFRYRTYFSTDFNPGTGQPIQSEHTYNWPIWDASENVEDTLKIDRYFGLYIPEVGLRNTDTYQKGPAFISSEDIFSTYKDTDLNFYEGGVAARRERGYPLRLQVEQMIYSWGFGDYRDFIFLKYEITNYSQDTLWQCWLAPVMDVDIARSLQASFGAGNDRTKFYDCDTTLNLAIQWSNTDRGEFGHGFGYLGFSFLESPAVTKYYDTTITVIRDPDSGEIIRVDTTKTLRPYNPAIDTIQPNFVRKDSKYYHHDDQLGLTTFRNWSIEFDPQEDEQRYQFISSKIREGDTGPGDKRFMMATGEFNMRPGDTARVVVGIILANGAKGGEVDGSCEDLAELDRKARFAQTVYDNNFRAPTPPDRAVINLVTPLNNGIVIQWDSTSEMSLDVDERGLDFMGYNIYRSRRPNLDGYSPNIEDGTAEYPLGRGPLGWKPVAAYALNPPFIKSENRAGLDQDDLTMPLIDDFNIVGPYTDETGKIIDSMAVRIMRKGVGMSVYDNAPGISRIDTSIFYSPWGQDWMRILREDPKVKFENNGSISTTYSPNLVYTLSPANRHYILDSVLIGVAYLNRSLLKFNPLLYQKKVLNRANSYFTYLDSLFPDWVVGERVRKFDSTEQKEVWIRATTDSIYIKNSVKRGEVNGQPMIMVECWVPRRVDPVLINYSDTLHLEEVKDSLMTWIKQSQVRMDYPSYEDRLYTRESVIAPYMRWRTNNRTFTDIGDDNRDGWINADKNPEITERLLNNIEYYYKVLAYDEGDYSQPTESKTNMASEGLPNFTTAIPSAAPANELAEIEVIYVDSAKIGGLYNWRFFSIDNDRVLQKFSGDTLELTIKPFWDQVQLTLSGETPGKLGFYRSLATLKSRLTGDTLYYGLFNYEAQPCQLSYYNLFTENAASFVLADSVVIDTISGKEIDFGVGTAKGIVTRTGRYFSGDFSYPGYCYSSDWFPNAYGMLGFSFDFTIQQFAGRLRADTIEYAEGVESTVITAGISDNYSRITSGNLDYVMLTQPVAFNYSTLQMIDGSFNNGPGIYEVEFLPGGVEEATFVYDSDANGNNPNIEKTFDVPYLNLRVRNIINYSRPEPGTSDSVLVNYPEEMSFVHLNPSDPPSRVTLYDGVPDYLNVHSRPFRTPDPRSLARDGRSTDEFIGNYNIFAIGYAAYSDRYSRSSTNALNLRRQFVRPKGNMGMSTLVDYSGLQGKYYLTAVSKDKADTVDFTNMVNIGGTYFAFDFSNKGSTVGFNTNVLTWDDKKLPEFNIWQARNFKAGDKVYLKTYGGALGLPMPDAQVHAAVSSKPENEDYLTDDLMEQIQISPNPYYIHHQAEKSPYDSKLFFSKLPARCTIDIYTVAGDLIATLNHDEYQNDGAQDRHAVYVWDLLTKNRQRIQSQALIAVITAPNGSQTVKNFSVVVGGFRLIEQ